jgi:hypothetical protein
MPLMRERPLPATVPRAPRGAPTEAAFNLIDHIRIVTP